MLYSKICNKVREDNKEQSMTTDEFIDAVESIVKEIMSREWMLGYKDRGMGHGDFAVLDSVTSFTVLECASRELAEHVIELHNKSLVN